MRKRFLAVLFVALTSGVLVVACNGPVAEAPTPEVK